MKNSLEEKRDWLADIRHAKTMQWQTTYYVLLAQAAIVGFYRLFKEQCLTLNDAVTNSFIAVSKYVPVTGTLVLALYLGDLYYYRQRKEECKGTKKSNWLLIIEKLLLFLITISFIAAFWVGEFLIILYLSNGSFQEAKSVLLSYGIFSFLGAVLLFIVWPRVRYNYTQKNQGMERGDS